MTEYRRIRKLKEDTMMEEFDKWRKEKPAELETMTEFILKKYGSLKTNELMFMLYWEVYRLRDMVKKS
jgi:hypothetical protein